MRARAFFSGQPGIRLFLVSTSLVACNAILDNERGTLRDTPSAPEPGMDANITESAHDGGVLSDGGASSADAASVLGSTGSRCSPGTKECGDRCVTLLEPAFGCGAGACTPCAIPNAKAACNAAGGCEMSACLPGFADCNANPVDGCETSLAAPTSCGGCGKVCPARPNAAPACSGISCGLACNPGFTDCNGDELDGCEVDVTSDPENCGACGNRCRRGRCAGGACIRHRN